MPPETAPDNAERPILLRIGGNAVREANEDEQREQVCTTLFSHLRNTDLEFSKLYNLHLLLMSTRLLYPLCQDFDFSNQSR